MIGLRLLLALAIQLALVTSGAAHELRPAYLEIRETAAGVFNVLWKVPALGDLRLGLYVRLPANCKPQAEPARSIDNGAYLERWTSACEGGLKGRQISVDGLSGTLTDALARIQYSDSSVEVVRLTPEHASFIAAGAQQVWQVAQTYLLLGVDHILGGFDHLLFVLALVLLIGDRWMLLKTITAFTVAHSITLAGASLGYFSLAQKPVEAAIALSIAFVASELIKMRPGERRLSEAYPWLVALTFGLLHGFGFAGALKEIGLPQLDVPIALLSFNVGVEAGQLMFVAVVLIAQTAAGRLIAVPPTGARRVAAYVIGVMAMLWFVDRLGSFVV